MIEIMQNIYVGSEQDYYDIPDTNSWAVLHCCKDPFHRQFVGNYRGNLPPGHPDYPYKIRGNEMALNLVDMDFFSAGYLDFNRRMFEAAFAFLDSYRAKECKILIHCNQGESRGPTLGMLYASRLGAFGYADFTTTVAAFRKIYPFYNPKKNIYETVMHLWNDFVKK
jgi:hypothetical protein